MATRIVILGGGTGGTIVANRLRRELGDAEIVVVDKDDDHVYQPGLLFVPFGRGDAADLVRPRGDQLHEGVDFRLAAVDRVEVAANRVYLEDGEELDYDVLVVASGSDLLPEETEGLSEALGHNAFTFYTPEGAVALRDALATFDGGRLVVNFVDLPIKCPVAPLEFAFLTDWFLHRHGVRERTELVYVTPLDGAFTKPIASAQLGGLLEHKGIALETEFATGQVDGARGRLVSWDEREVPFDLLVSVPLHGGAPFVARSPGLGDDLGFVVVDPYTLQAKVAPNVFALGDAANVPTSKAGSVTHYEAETVVDNVQRVLAGRSLEYTFDGHATCFIETGFHKALLIDFDYEREPRPGKESHVHHIGKLLFERIYWNVLLAGREGVLR
jgi:sulfide:quinone oxidoreductase